MLKRRSIKVLAGFALALSFCWLIQRILFFPLYYHQNEWLDWKQQTVRSTRRSARVPPCAINLYGLPRQFKALVLPSFVKHVIQVNAKYQCDYFVQYYDLREEHYDRREDSGRSGSIDPEEVKLLTEFVLQAHDAFVASSTTGGLSNGDVAPPIVDYVQTTDESFYERYQPLLDQIHTARGGPNNHTLLYIPTSETTPFPNSSLTNIIKMWHSQESVWHLMQQQHSATSRSSMTSRRQGQPRPYARVAMFRNDVLYTTPIDIYQLPDGSTDRDNRFAVIPNFAKYPVNDRMMIGPTTAVQIWAAGRFERLAEHVQRVASTGDGIHPEKYLYHTIFPAIRNATGVTAILNDPNVCFLRVRSDGSVRIQDCGSRCVTEHNAKVVEHIIQRPCRLNQSNPNLAYLECGEDAILLDTSANNRSYNEATTWETCSRKRKSIFSTTRWPIKWPRHLAQT